MGVRIGCGAVSAVRIPAVGSCRCLRLRSEVVPRRCSGDVRRCNFHEGSCGAVRRGVVKATPTGWMHIGGSGDDDDCGDKNNGDDYDNEKDYYLH